MHKLRKGIYHEKGRSRYRVRLHKFGRVVHRSYHATLEEAEAALEVAIHDRREVPEPKPRVEAELTPQNLLAALITSS